MDSRESLDVDYARFERLVAEVCTVPADEFPPGDVLLPLDGPISIPTSLLAAAGVDEYDYNTVNDTRIVEEFEDRKAEQVASFAFWSDGVEMYRYRMRDGRCFICWRGESDGLVGIALLRDEGVYPLFFEELIASCGDFVHVIGWGSLPEEISASVSPDTLLRATLRFLTYADDAEAWDHYARLGRRGEMPVTLPGPAPAWLRRQDIGYWDAAYAFVRDVARSFADVA